MKVKKSYEAPEVEVLMMQAECMCTGSDEFRIPTSDAVIEDIDDENIEKAIKGQSLFDVNSMIGFPQF